MNNYQLISRFIQLTDEDVNSGKTRKGSTYRFLGPILYDDHGTPIMYRKEENYFLYLVEESSCYSLNTALWIYYRKRFGGELHDYYNNRIYDNDLDCLLDERLKLVCVPQFIWPRSYEIPIRPKIKNLELRQWSLEIHDEYHNELKELTDEKIRRSLDRHTRLIGQFASKWQAYHTVNRYTEQHKVMGWEYSDEYRATYDKMVACTVAATLRGERYVPKLLPLD